MNDYKELLEELRAHCLCITNGDNCNNCEGLISEKAYCRLQIELHKQAADAIEQLIKDKKELIKSKGVIKVPVAYSEEFFTKELLMRRMKSEETDES